MSLSKSDDLPSGWLDVGALPSSYSQCPVCDALLADDVILAHIDACLAESGSRERENDVQSHAGGDPDTAVLGAASLAPSSPSPSLGLPRSLCFRVLVHESGLVNVEIHLDLGVVPRSPIPPPCFFVLQVLGFFHSSLY